MFESPDIGVYAEIGDVKSSFSYTQNIVYGTSNSYQQNPKYHQHDHDYDDAKLVQAAVSLDMNYTAPPEMDSELPLKPNNTVPLEMNGATPLGKVPLEEDEAKTTEE